MASSALSPPRPFGGDWSSSPSRFSGVFGPDGAIPSLASTGADATATPARLMNSDSVASLRGAETPYADAASSSPHASMTDGVDHLGHFRVLSPSTMQSSSSMPHSSLHGLGGLKVRDLFASHASRLHLTRDDVLKKAAHSQLYVPRKAKRMDKEDFKEFEAAAHAYESTLAHMTPQQRAKAIARGTHTGSDPVAAAVAAAASAAASGGSVGSLSSSSLAPTMSGTAIPLISPSLTLDSSKLAATEAYLAEIWNENRSKEAADLRLKKHIKSMVNEWSRNLAKFEEEVARRQEDSFHAKHRRRQLQPLAQSMTANFNTEEKQCSGMGEDLAAHHRCEAYSTSTVGKATHADAWTMGTDLAIIDPKAGKISKEAMKRKKAALDQQLSHSIAASTVAAAPKPSPLHSILQSVQAEQTAMSQTHSLANEITHPLSFSAFRPNSSPAVRALVQQKMRDMSSDADMDIMDSSQQPAAGTASATATSAKLPQLGASALLPQGPPPGLSVRSNHLSAYAGKGHGAPPTDSFSQPHVFSNRLMAQTAAIPAPHTNPSHSSIHLATRDEMMHVARIKDRLASENINVPRGVLERALVAPTIAPLDAERRAVERPTPFFGLVPENPFATKPKKKKAKGGKKGKKK